MTKESLEQRIYQEISRAILEGALRPGTKLAEGQVAKIFDVSRERVRKVLDRLVHERKLERIAHRGVFVPKLTVPDAREVYKARRVLEAGIAVSLCAEVSTEDIKVLRKHIEAEKTALACGNQGEFARLAGDFHILLVDLLDNAELSRMVRELVTRSSIFMSLYHPILLADCSSDEHEMLVDALQSRDVLRALQVAQAHLQAVESRLLVDTSAADRVDLTAILKAAT